MKQALKWLLLIVYLLTFIIPGYIYFVVNQAGTQILQSGDVRVSMLVLFRVFGLYAFILVWSQMMLGALRTPLQKLYGAKVLKLHLFFGPFTLLFAFTHYALFTLANFLMGLDPIKGMSSYLGPNYLYGYLGVTAFYLMVLTVISAMLRTRPFIQKYWRRIHYLNYLIFIFAFIHSFFIGTEVQSQPLHTMYYLFAVSYLVASGYKWWYKRFLKK